MKNKSFLLAMAMLLFSVTIHAQDAGEPAKPKSDTDRYIDSLLGEWAGKSKTETKTTSTTNGMVTTTVTETKISNSSRISTMTIGTQKWMVKNLEVISFRNGDLIKQAKNRDEWDDASDNGEPVWCYYNNDPANGPKYGKLYNWYAVNDPRGLAPEGWHIPTDAEWQTLSIYLGGEMKAGAKMKAETGWNDNGNGDNSSGFTGLPGGIRPDYGNDFDIGSTAVFWSATSYSDTDARSFSLDSKNAMLFRSYNEKERGYSVRCIKN